MAENGTVILEDFIQSLLSSVNRASRRKSNKETLDLNDTSDQMDLRDYTEHFLQQQASVCSSLAHREHFQDGTYIVRSQS